jgi:hypothetical protein
MSDTLSKDHLTIKGRLIALFIGVLLLLIICEVGMRAIGFRPGNPFERLINHYDSYLGYRMIPGMKESIKGPNNVYNVEIVSLGFEDNIGFRDNRIEKPVAGIFLGDSMVWGYGVNIENSISEVLEKLTGKNFVNMGMTAWTSPIQYKRLLEKYGVLLSPKFVFVGLFIGNDFEDCQSFSEWVKSKAKISYPEWRTIKDKNANNHSIYMRSKRFLYTRSALFRTLSDRITFTVKKPKNDVLHVQSGSFDIYLYKSQLLKKATAEQSDMVKLSLQGIKEISNGIESYPVVLLIPTKEMVYQHLFPEENLKAHIDHRYDSLLKILNELDMSYIDFFPIFREKALLGDQLYFKTDGHWNINGQSLAAESIRDYLIGKTN